MLFESKVKHVSLKYAYFEWSLAQLLFSLHLFSMLTMLMPTLLPVLNSPVLFAQISILDLQTGPFSCQPVQRLPDVGQLLLVQPAHIPHLPAFRFILLLQLDQHGGAFALQLLNPLDVVGQAVVEVSELVFLLDAGQAGRAGAGCGQAGGCAAAGGRAAGAAAGGGGGGGGGGHDCGGLDGPSQGPQVIQTV